MTGDALGAFKKEAHMAVADGVLSLLAGDIHCAIGTEAAVQTPEASFTPVFPVLVLPAAAHSVPVHYTRRNLHLEHFVPAPGAAQASSEMVLQGSVGARGTHPAVRVSPWTRTVIVQIGTFVALGAANGAILRVVIFSLGTGTLSLLQVPGVRDQPLNPCGVHICQQSWKHQWQQQARHGGEAHVRPAVASQSPIRAGAVAARDSDSNTVLAYAQWSPGLGSGSGGLRLGRGHSPIRRTSNPEGQPCGPEPGELRENLS